MYNTKEKVKNYNKRYREKHKEELDHKNKVWRDANKDKIREINLRRMGFTPEMFERALVVQEYICPICCVDLRTLPTKQVHADHCHLTNTARGVLCHHCNAALGGFKENVDILMRAIMYLENPTLKGEKYEFTNTRRKRKPGAGRPG